MRRARWLIKVPAAGLDGSFSIKAVAEGLVDVEEAWVDLDELELRATVVGSRAAVGEVLSRINVPGVQVAFRGHVKRWRRYRLAAGICGLGVQRDHGGWHVTVACWVWTTGVMGR